MAHCPIGAFLFLSAAGTVFGGGHAGDLQEIAVEGGVVDIAHGIRNLGDGSVRICTDQHLGLGNSLAGNILPERHSRKLRKYREEHRTGHTVLLGKLSRRQGFFIMRIHIAYALDHSAAVIRQSTVSLLILRLLVIALGKYV